MQTDFFPSENYAVCSPADRIKDLHPWLKECGVSDCDGFIAAHYLESRPAIVTLCLMLMLNSKPAGCVVFAMPPRETDVRYKGTTWELARLYLKDEVPHNSESWLISASVRWIKNHRPGVKYLVSYADPTAGHKGTIYRASGWKSDGMTDQDRKTPRFDYGALGKVFSRKSHVPQGAEITRIPRCSKFRFYLCLN